MILTSLSRIEKYTGLSMDVSTDEGMNNVRQAKIWISATSNDIQDKLGRRIEKTTYTEDLDIRQGQRIFPLLAHPVTSITSVSHDSVSLFDGTETELDDSNYSIGPHAESLQMTYDLFPGRKTLRVVYVGGLAVSASRSTFVLTGASNMTVGKYVAGSSSLAVGLIVDATSAAFIVEVLYGVFEAGETLTEQDTEFAVGTATGTGVLASVTARCLAEVAPELVLACEVEIRYRMKHMHDFENSGTQREGINRRSGADKYDLQPETWSLLNSFIRTHL